VERFDRGALVAAVIAATLGTASAAVSAYWALGGEALLDTVGGDIERWGRERSADVVVVLWVIVVLKLVGAGAPLIFVGVGHLPAWTRSRRTRALGWAAAVGLTVVYGGVLSVAGWLIEAGVVDAADDADEHALAWHAYFWDPWFALWGGAFVVAMWRSRPQPSEQTVQNEPSERSPSPLQQRPRTCS
jgi:MFS family permease